MVSIDLDNIIHYRPSPIPKPYCKPPHLIFSSYGSFYPHSNQPILIHPLPPRPPCLSHESPQTSSSPRQNPSLAVPRLPNDRDDRLNDFDKELMDLETAESVSRGTLGLCFEGSEGSKSEITNDTQRKGLHDQYGTSHNNDRYRDELRPLSEDPATPQDTATSSNAAETDLSSAAGSPSSPVVANDSISLNEPCPIQDPSSIERRETQFSIFGCETEINGVAAGELCRGLTSQHDYSIPRDEAPLPNPGTPVPAEDEPESANQRLLRRSSETCTEPRKSSLPPITEANSIQLHARSLSATRDSHLGVRCDSNGLHSTDDCLSDEAVSTPTSPVLQQQKQAVSRSEGKDSCRDLSSSCSVSVVVPITRSHTLPITRSTRAGYTRCTGKRKNRAKSPCDVDSDDPDDSDYTDRNDSGVGNIARLPRLTKRQRQTAAIKTQPARARRPSPHHVFSSPAPEEEIANPCPATSLQDIQTIPVRGFLTRQTILSRVIYSCTFEEDRQPSCPHGPIKAPTYDKNLENKRHASQPSSKKQPARATRFLPDEDERLIELKEKRGLPWSRIVKHFPGRTKGSLQVRYSTKLKDR